MDSGNIQIRHVNALKIGFEGDFDGSLSALKALVAELPDEVEVLYDLAMTQMMLGSFEDACQNLKLVLVKDPSHAKALKQVIRC